MARPGPAQPTPPTNPFHDRPGAPGIRVLDGGLATALEARGFDLDDPLWSARILIESPQAIREVHRAYLEAGADCVTSASYQASLEGFERIGLTRGEGAALLRRSVELAYEAREEVWSRPSQRFGRRLPAVAASIGPYGAVRADGSEYTGEYDLDEDGLVAFHRERWHILAEAGADLLACETIPSVVEARALLRLFDETPGQQGWISFSCSDDAHLCDGSPIGEAVEGAADRPNVVAVGVNCTAPANVGGLISALRRATDLPILVYPNAGETYRIETRSWESAPDAVEWGEAGRRWRAAGAQAVGGCCRVGPEEIRRIGGAIREG